MRVTGIDHARGVDVGCAGVDGCVARARTRIASVHRFDETSIIVVDELA